MFDLITHYFKSHLIIKIYDWIIVWKKFTLLMLKINLFLNQFLSNKFICLLIWWKKYIIHTLKFLRNYEGLRHPIRIAQTAHNALLEWLSAMIVYMHIACANCDLLQAHTPLDSPTAAGSPIEYTASASKAQWTQHWTGNTQYSYNKCARGTWIQE